MDGVINIINRLYNEVIRISNKFKYLTAVIIYSAAILLVNIIHSARRALLLSYDGEHYEYFFEDSRYFLIGFLVIAALWAIWWYIYIKRNSSSDTMKTVAAWVGTIVPALAVIIFLIFVIACCSDYIDTSRNYYTDDLYLDIFPMLAWYTPIMVILSLFVLNIVFGDLYLSYNRNRFSDIDTRKYFIIALVSIVSVFQIFLMYFNLATTVLELISDAVMTGGTAILFTKTAIELSSAVPSSNTRCPACKTLNPADRDFCKSCGMGLITHNEEKKCPMCGASVEHDALFCGVCGRKLQADRSGQKSSVCICPECSAENPPDRKFCKKCGEKLK